MVTASRQAAPKLEPRSSAPRRMCSICGGNFALRLDRKPRAHHAGGQICIGSNSSANQTNGQTQTVHALEISELPRYFAEDEQKFLLHSEEIS